MVICGAYPPAMALARSSLSSALDAAAAPIARGACPSTSSSLIAGSTCCSRRRPSETSLRCECVLSSARKTAKREEWRLASDGWRRRKWQCRAKTYTVEINQGDATHVLQVPEDETILSVALDAELDLPHDCKLGVCMTCPAKMEKGEVDQSGGMLSEDVIDQGYALMCVSYPLSDCKVRTIPEEELLKVQLATAND